MIPDGPLFFPGNATCQWPAHRWAPSGQMPGQNKAPRRVRRGLAGRRWGPGASRVGGSAERGWRAVQTEQAGCTADKVVTISLGIGFAQPGAVASAELLVGLADAQLYRAKQEGRSRVCSDLVQEQ